MVHSLPLIQTKIEVSQTAVERIRQTFSGTVVYHQRRNQNPNNLTRKGEATNMSIQSVMDTPAKDLKSCRISRAKILDLTSINELQQILIEEGGFVLENSEVYYRTDPNTDDRIYYERMLPDTFNNGG